jgi:phosphoglucosamine mutase
MKKLFGTDGFRGIANVDLTADYAYLIGRFLASLELKRKRILIGMDTRISSSMLSHALISGILVSGGDAFDLGVTSTPCLAYLTKKHEFDYGIMITASHNPYQDNGIKIFDKDGYKMSGFQEKCLEQYLNDGNDNLPKANSYNIGRSYDVKHYVNDYITHINAIYPIKEFKDNFILDLANGSMCYIIDKVIDKNLVSCHPSGYNINENCGATSLHNLSAFVKQNNTKFGFAFDGDGDRIQGVLNDGTIISGDHILYVIANYLLKKGELKNCGVVITIMSNLGLIKYFKDINVKCSITSVGDKQVLSEMIKNDYVLGGEQSGHILINGLATTGDGLLTLAYLLKIIDEEGVELKDLVKELRLYPQVLENVHVNDKTIIEKEEFQTYLKNCMLTLGDEGRIVVRASGTEKLIRVMVEANKEDIASQYVSLITTKIKSFI